MFSKAKFSTLVLLILLSNLAFSNSMRHDTLSTKAKIDSIFVMQKQIYKDNINEPLQSKKFGIELNLIRLLLSKDAFTFSGTFSLFNVNRNAELAFPIYYCNPSSKDDLKSFTLDCHYRLFIGDHQNGMYFSGFARYAYLEGYEGGNNPFSDYRGPRSSENKFGIGFGLGYRYFSNKGFYWGTSLSVGRYIIGKNSKFENDLIDLSDDNETIVDFEFLKFGWAF